MQAFEFEQPFQTHMKHPYHLSRARGLLYMGTCLVFGVGGEVFDIPMKDLFWL